MYGSVDELVDDLVVSATLKTRTLQSEVELVLQQCRIIGPDVQNHREDAAFLPPKNNRTTRKKKSSKTMSKGWSING